jgi:hypothetical protein
MIKYCIGGPDPLDGISLYENTEPRPHYHLISYGLSDLYKKSEGTDPGISGWGYEFTMRVAMDPDSNEPPYWAINLMQNLARATFEGGSIFGPLHSIDCNGPIRQGSSTMLSAVMFVVDPELGEIETPHGKLQFLQLVGITADELRTKNMWDANRIVELLSRNNPLKITDLARRSILEDPAISRIADEGIAQQGSSCNELHVSEISWRRAILSKAMTVTIGAGVVERIRDLFPSRLLHDLPIGLRSKDASVDFVSGAASGWSVEQKVLTLVLSRESIEEIRHELLPRRGTYRFQTLPGLIVHVLPTHIRDKTGNIIETIG